MFHSKYHILDNDSVFSQQHHDASIPEEHKDRGGQDASEEEIVREEQLQNATKLLMDSANMGYTNAQTAMGQLFELREEFDAARGWYELAASNGCLRAVNILGMMYYEGLGVPKLREKAFALFEEASLVVL